MSLSELEPVSRETTAGIIARQLRIAIMNGSMPAGAQLRESNLASQLQVSRGPLREAMQRLVQEGLLRSERHRGLFVNELEPADVFDIYITRNAIERAAASLIMLSDRSEACDKLAAVHEQMRLAAEADDIEQLSEADARFHQLLVTLSGSRRLTRLAQTLLIETWMCIAALQRSYKLPSDRVAEHGAMVEAIRNGEAAKLLELIEAHMEDAIQRLAPGCSLYSAPPGRAADEDNEFNADEEPILGPVSENGATQFSFSNVRPAVRSRRLAGSNSSAKAKAATTRKRGQRPRT